MLKKERVHVFCFVGVLNDDIHSSVTRVVISYKQHTLRHSASCYFLCLPRWYSVSVGGLYTCRGKYVSIDNKDIRQSNLNNIKACTKQNGKQNKTEYHHVSMAIQMFL